MAVVIPEPFAEESTATTGTGALTLAGAIDARHQTVNAAVGTNNSVFYYLLDGNGTAWEAGWGTSTGATGFSRDTIWKSTNADAAINLSANTHTLRIGPSPFANNVGGSGITGRLSLHPTDPFYDPTNTVAVSGQDATANTLTCTGHKWSTGTMATSSATSGGLTAGTAYFVRAVGADTISLHASLAHAIENTNLIDITGAVTANIIAYGVSNQSVYFIPVEGDKIDLWNGSAWVPTVYGPTEIPLGTMTTSIGYDIFVYYSSGALAYELLAWASATARATELEWSDGRLVKVGDKTRRWAGAIYARTTTRTEISWRTRYVFNADIQIEAAMHAFDTAASWTNTTAAYQAANNSQTNASVTVFDGLGTGVLHGQALGLSLNATAAVDRRVNVGLDSTTVPEAIDAYTNLGSNNGAPCVCPFSIKPGLGLHYVCQLEYSMALGTTTWYAGVSVNGKGGYSGLFATWSW